MTRFEKQRARRNRQRFSDMGKKSQAVQRERREAALDDAARRDFITNPPLTQGDAIGLLEYRDFRTGRIARWTICRGDRSNNFTLKHPDGRRSKPHGLAWLLTKIRPIILGSNRSPVSTGQTPPRPRP